MNVIDESGGELKGPARPRVLVLMATYNAGAWLHEQIDSILAQQGVNIQIIIGDDVSKDSTRAEILERWGDGSQVELVGWETPSGSAGANFRRLYRNVDVSDYDLVALADQDDVWFPDKLINAAHAMQASGAQGYSSAVEAFWSDGSTKIISQDSTTRKADYLFEGAGQGCTFVVTRALFARVQDFCVTQHASTEAVHYHDWLIYLLARTWNMQWYFDPKPSMRYRQHDNNEIGSRGSIASVFKRLKMIKNGWYFGQVSAALNVANIADGCSVSAFHRLFNGRRSTVRGLKVAYFSILHGRRRFSDRIVLAIAACAGWI